MTGQTLAPAADHPVHPSTARVGGARTIALGFAITVVWLAVLFSSLYAPALVVGSEHETIALVAFADWLWGGLATAFLLLAAAFSRPEVEGVWPIVAIVTAVIWVAVGVASVYAPSIVTGSDPTTVPIVGLLAPVAGVIVTGYLSVYAAGASSRSTG